MHLEEKQKVVPVLRNKISIRKAVKEEKPYEVPIIKLEKT
jgi:hypothetical protein